MEPRELLRFNMGLKELFGFDIILRDLLWLDLLRGLFKFDLTSRELLIFDFELMAQSS